MAADFHTELNLVYQFDESGQANVTYNISITNLNTNKFADSYKLFIDNVDPLELKAYEGGQEIPSAIAQDTNGKYINVTFPDPAVGLNVKRDFKIIFKNSKLALREGDIWEITAERLKNPDSFDVYTSSISVPSSFGQLAYVSPKYVSNFSDSLNQIFVFDKQSLANSAISMGFGNFQVFSYDLTYHLENPLSQASNIEVAIPMDTSYQRMIYKSLTPKPAAMKIDTDGNWIVTVSLAPKERVDLKASGWVQIFASPRKTEYESSDFTNYLKQTSYWQTNDPYIKNLAHKLGSVNAIYNYIVSNFKYDYTKTTTISQRLGAKDALLNPTSAICTEFTDSFIALTRALGIPAREVNGYAYTSNSQTEPLSLVADVLHSWPEYWDKTKGVWVQVDPTWGETSSTDYFNKLDLRHFAFVVHGIDDSKPYPAGSYKLGANPQKDVFVNLSELPIVRTGKLSVDFTVIRQFPFLDMWIVANIKNDGVEALYNQKVLISYDKQVSREINIPYLLPKENRSEDIIIPYSFLGSNMPDRVSITGDGISYDLSTYKNSVIVTNLIAVLILIFVLIVGIVFLIKKRAKKTK